MRVLRLAAMMAAAVGLFTGPAQAGDTITVGKAVPFAWTFIPIDVGIEAGIWKKHGFDEVKITGFGGDAKMQQGLLSKDIDFGLGSGPGLAFNAKGGAGMGVAAFYGAPYNLSAVVLYDSPLSDTSQLKGKKLGVTTKGALTDWLVMKLSQHHGWGNDGIVSAPLGGLDTSLAALKTKQVDGLVLATEVGYTLEDKKEAKRIYNFAKLVPDFITHVIFARKELVAAKPEMVQRFVAGFFETLDYMRQNKAKVVEVTNRVLKQPPALAARVYDEEMPGYSKTGAFDPKAMALLKESFVEMGLLQSKPSDDQLYTTRFLPRR